MSLGFGGVSVFGVLFAFNLVVSLSDVISARLYVGEAP